MASATAEKGYAATTVADILARAGVSRETFYEQFRSKLDCFEQAFEHASRTLFSYVDDVVAAGSQAAPRSPAPGEAETVGARFERALGAYLDAMATEADLARLCLVEVYAAGPDLIRARTEMQQLFTERLAGMFGATDGPGRFACEALVAAIGSMVTSRLALGQADTLGELREHFAGLARLALGRAGPGG